MIQSYNPIKYMRYLSKKVRDILVSLSKKSNVIFALRKYFRAMLTMLAWLDHLTSKSTGHTYFIQNGSNLNKIFCMAHYSNDSKLDSCDANILKKAKELGFYTILYTNQDSIVSHYVDRIILKPIRGRDAAVLANFAKGLRHLKVEDAVDICFMNNSFAWDPQCFEEIYSQATSGPKNTIVFPTESCYPSQHVQPYSLFVSLDELGLTKFSDSFNWIRAWRFKRTTVVFYEYRLFRVLQQKGWSLLSICDAKSLFAEYQTLFNLEITFERYGTLDINPTSDLWSVLPKLGLVGVKKQTAISLSTAKQTGYQAPFEQEFLKTKFFESVIVQRSGTCSHN